MQYVMRIDLLYILQTCTCKNTQEYGYGKEIKEKGQIEDKRRMSRLHVSRDESVHLAVRRSVIEVAN